MTGTELLRLTMVVAAGANIGLTAAMFEIVGKHVVPRRGMRTVMLSYALLCAGIMVGSITQFHKPPTSWAVYVVLAGITGILGGLVSVFFWYRTPAGIRHSATMRESVAHER